MFVCDSITAIILFAQFSILRSRAILVIASGYLFTALILIPWILAFPGVFAPTTWLIGGLHDHVVALRCRGTVVLPLFVTRLRFVKGCGSEQEILAGHEPRSAIARSVAVTATVVLAVRILLRSGRSAVAP